MIGRTHKMIGAVAGTALFVTAAPLILTGDTLTDGISISVGAMGVILGSVICDIDEPNSSIGRKLWFITLPIAIIKLILSIISYFCYGKFGKMLDDINTSTDHRGITHSLITWMFMNICYGGIYMYLSISLGDGSAAHIFGVFSVFLSLGILTHLLSDFCSGLGIPLLEPLSHVRIGLKQLTGYAVAYNGAVEMCIRIVCFFGTGAMLTGYLGIDKLIV